jgi:DNA-binding NtrC family response regulator
MATILCVDDEPDVLYVLRRTLTNGGHRVVTAGDAGQAQDVLRNEVIDLIVSDYRMPGVSGVEFLQLLHETGAGIPVIMLTGFASIENAVISLKAGAVDYLEKPIRSDRLLLVVNQSLAANQLRRETAQLRERVSQQRPDRSIIGDSTSLRRVIEAIETVAATRATVLLTGESGTGKELLARQIHHLSDRRNGPFVAINCAALPEALVESTLFGHEKGAFTGAVKQVKGVFERGHRGTLLLDEVSEMRLDLQAKLLRVLQEQEFERVGGNTQLRVDTRVIATTNRDLRREVADGRFREDLYYRLSVVQLRVPALRERLEDLPLLVDHFVQRAARESSRDITAVSAEALHHLRAHAWPGNIRELAHAVERAVILARGNIIGPEAFDLPDRAAASIAQNSSASQALPDMSSALTAASLSSNGTGVSTVNGPSTHTAGGVRLPSLRIADAEKLLIDSALAAANHNRTRAADLLGISVRTLRNKLNRPDDPTDA